MSRRASSARPTSLALAFGRYEHVGELGQGGSGRVVEVRDHAAGQRLKALKIVDPAHAERLAWELAVLSSASHPSLARVHELLRVDAALPPPFALPAGVFVLVEDRAPGDPSAAVMAEPEPARRAERVREAALAVCGALTTLHARGLVHGDVKPANVIVRAGPPLEVTLVDLGLASAFGHGGKGGTPRYLAPEAWLGERSPGTDLYALGATLHDWLLGASHDASRSDASHEQVQRWAPLPPWVPADLAQVVQACLAEAAAERPRSARDVARSLGAPPDVISLLGTPTPTERARRAAVVPLVGRGREVSSLSRALVAAMSEGRALRIDVRGAPGSGRTRVVLEGVRRAQRELAAQPGVQPPTFVTFTGEAAVPRVPTIVHAARGEAGALALHEAAALSGACLAVIVERDAAGEASGDEIVLAPLAATPFAELVQELAGAGRASAEVVDAYRRATGGLPGVLVRAFAERWARGEDPRSGPDDRTASAAEVPVEARALALGAAIAGGTIDAHAARRIAGRDAERLAEALVVRGLAERDESGLLVLRADVAPLVIDQASREEARRVGTQLVSVARSGPVRALALSAAGVEQEARARLLDEARALRDRGAPEQAVRLLDRGRRWVDDERLAVAHADAALAAGRVDVALATLGAHASPDARLLRAEALRRAGRLDEAWREVEVPALAGHAGALACRARIALARGEPPPALALEGDDAQGLFALETAALVALTHGHAEDALRLSQAGVARAEASPRLAAHERARAVARLSSVEASARAVLGDVDGAHAAHERSATQAERAGERHATAAFLVNLGTGRLDVGLLGPAIEALGEGTERLVLLGRPRDAARALYNLANAAVLAGDRAYARHAAEGALREAERVGDAEARTLAHVVLADVETGEGRPRAAERRLAAILETSGGALVAARLASVRAMLLDLEGARDALARAEGVTSAEQTERSMAEARIALATGEIVAARRAVAAALAQQGHGGSFEIRTRLFAVAADVAESAGDAGGAEAHLRALRALLDRALASLPTDRHADFRALHARTLAVRTDAPSTEGPDAARVLAHARAVLDATRTSAIAERLVVAARAIAAAEHALLVVRDAEGALVVRASASAGHDDGTPRYSTSIVTRCLDGRAPVSSLDAGADLALAGGSSIHALAVRSVIALPVRVGDKPGVLYVDDRLRPSAFGEGATRALVDLVGFAETGFARASEARRARRALLIAGRRERSLRETLDAKTREAARLAAEHPSESLIAESVAMRDVVALASRVAPSDTALLFRGESGTGKEVLARFVHRTSSRAAGPFVAESCAAIPEALLESTLFGHVRGAFSGAVARRRGLFELADAGTLFLDEVGEMPLAMQAKLLRVLSSRQLRPVGSERERPIDVRVVTATHRDLREMVARGTFREDLFYRLAVVEIVVPPLRERAADVEPLVRHFVHALAGKGAPAEVEPAALAALAGHSWPGNVRELENEVRRALALDARHLRAANLSPSLSAGAPSEEVLDLKAATEALERRLVELAMRRAGRNVTRAASLLGLSRFGLQKILARHAKKP